MTRIIIFDEETIIEAGEVRPEAEQFISLIPQFEERYATNVYVLSEKDTPIPGTNGNINPESLDKLLKLNPEAILVSDYHKPNCIKYNEWFGQVKVSEIAKELGISDSIVRRHIRQKRLTAIKGKARRGHVVYRLSVEHFKCGGRRKWSKKNG